MVVTEVLHNAYGTSLRLLALNHACHRILLTCCSHKILQSRDRGIHTSGAVWPEPHEEMVSVVSSEASGLSEGLALVHSGSMCGIIIPPFPFYTTLDRF